MRFGVKLSPNSEFAPNEPCYLTSHLIPLSLVFHNIITPVPWSYYDMSSDGQELCEAQSGYSLKIRYN